MTNESFSMLRQHQKYDLLFFYLKKIVALAKPELNHQVVRFQLYSQFV